MISQITISADTVAWYGAIVATASVIFSGINLWRDRPRIKILYRKSYIHNAPIYDSNEPYLNIEVINIGRRTIPVGNVGIKLFDGSALLLDDSLIRSRNTVLTEQNPRTNFFVLYNIVDFAKSHYISIFDEAGREYKKYFSCIPTIRKLFYKKVNQ
jgi:hypothetical protein